MPTPNSPVPASPSLLTPKPAVLPTKGGNTQALPGQTPKGLPGPTAKPKNKLLVGLGLGVIAIVVVVLIITSVLGKLKNQAKPSSDPRLKPTPTLIPRPTLEQTLQGEPSVYATDPQILELEAAIKSLYAQIESDNFTEPEIQPPVLEVNIKF